jgi:hypothetical protein
MIRRLEMGADEMARFVKKKANKPWMWIAMDAIPRPVMALHVGDRSRKSAKRLWAKIPEALHGVHYPSISEASAIPADSAVSLTHPRLVFARIS